VVPAGARRCLAPDHPLFTRTPHGAKLVSLVDLSVCTSDHHSGAKWSMVSNWCLRQICKIAQVHQFSPVWYQSIRMVPYWWRWRITPDFHHSGAKWWQKNYAPHQGVEPGPTSPLLIRRHNHPNICTSSYLTADCRTVPGLTSVAPDGGSNVYV